VLIVGPGGFATIQAAVDAAVDGDVVRIAPGIYNNFICTKGLTLLCDPPGTVRITRLTSAPSGTSFSMTPLVTPAAAAAALRPGLRPGSGVRLLERGHQRRCLVDRAMHVRGQPESDAGPWRRTRPAVMRHCTLQGVGAPLFVTCLFARDGLAVHVHERPGDRDLELQRSGDRAGLPLRSSRTAR
jgi:hypothetical protein